MKCFLLIFFLLYASFSNAQPIEVRYSEPFEARDRLASRLVICGNGNTMLFNVKRNELEIYLYDSGRRLIRQERVAGHLLSPDQLASGRVCAVFPAGEEVLVFLQVNVPERVSRLFRLAFSAESGRLIRKDDMPGMPETEALAAVPGGLPPATVFSVRNDPASGSYAVACHPEYPSKGDRPVRICHYSPQHREIGRGTLPASGSERYFGDMIVCDTAAVWIATSSGIRLPGGASFEYHAQLTRLRGADTASVVLKRWKALEPARILLAYSGKDRSIRLAMHAETDSLAGRRGRPGADARIASVEAEQLRVNYIRPIAFDAVGYYRRNQFGLSLPFSGIPTDIFVDGHGGMDVLCREYGGGMTHDLAVLQFDAAGTPGAAFSARRANPAPHNASVARIRRGELDLRTGTGGDMAFDYLRLPADRIIIYNDHPANLTRNQRAVPKILQHPPAAQATANSARRGRSHLFGSGTDGRTERGNQFADFYSGTWDGGTGTYAVLITERAGLLKQQRVAWVRF